MIGLKRLVAVVCLAGLTFGAFAQGLVRGTVKDKATGSAVGYATVAVVQDGKVIVATASDAEGRFSVRTQEKGAYKIEITAVGYQSAVSDIALSGEVIDMGDVLLTEGVEVETVTLAVQKPIVTTDAEKMSYSVEDDPSAQSSTLEEIIRKVPQLSIDADGNVLLNGSSDYKILVNGHAANSMSRNFKDIIKTMPASSIKKLEVITNPSMKYDADGTSGILNIVTTKARFDGYSGSVNASASNSFDRSYGINTSANIAIQKNKFSISGAIYFNQHDGLNGRKSDVQVNMINKGNDNMSFGRRFSDGYQCHKWHGLYGTLNASYQIDSLNMLTFEFEAWGGRHRQLSGYDTKLFDAEGAEIFDRGFSHTERSIGRWKGIDATLAYEHSFRREGHTLTISDAFSVEPPITGITPEIVVPNVGDQYRITNTDRQRGHSNVLQIDYHNPITKEHTIEVGLKHHYSFDSSVKNTLMDQIADEGSSKLSRQILALYGGYAYNRKSWSARAGARAEMAWYSLDETTLDKRLTPRLFDVVPYVSLTYMPAVGHSLSLAYTERLTRPTVSNMSPFVTVGSMYKEYGNPELRSGLSHSLILKYAYTSNKWSAVLSAMTRLSNNMVTHYSFLDEDGYLNRTYANKGRYQSYGMDLTLSYRPSAKFSLSASLRGGWTECRVDSDNICNSGWAFTERVNANIALWKGAMLTLSQGAMRMEPGFMGSSNIIFVDTSIRLGQKFLKDKLEASISLSNPHCTYNKYNQRVTTDSYIMDVSARMLMRRIALAISYRFGKRGVDVRRVNRKDDSLTEDLSSGNKQGGGM